METAWKKFDPNNASIETKDELAKLIINEFIDIRNEFFSIKGDKQRPRRTTLIKDAFSKLGRKELPFKPRYKVYANGLSEELTIAKGGDFRNAEWLFDLHWYTEGKNPYTTVSLPLIMECEWQQKRKGDKVNEFSGIKYDFQKLLVSNAEFRLMIFKVTKPTDFAKLSDYFEDNIGNYKHLEKGSKFLFIAFSEREKTFYYQLIKK